MMLKLLSFILAIIYLSVFFLYPLSSARANVIGGLSCTAGGLLAPFLQQGIDSLLSSLGISLGGLTGGFGGRVPVIDQKFIDAWRGKESRGDIIARCLAREILNKMNKGVLDIVRKSGRNGGPAYVRNWRNFQADAQYRGEGIFRAVLGNSNLCKYYGDDLKKLFGAKKTSLANQRTRVDNLDPFALRANCTLPSNFDMEKYQEDFSRNGGWEAWNRLLEPQNNYYGSLFQSLDEIAKQRRLEETSDLNEAISGGGFTSKRDKDANDSCLIKDASGKCLAYKDIKTPGKTIGDAVTATIHQELAWVTSVDELSEIISAATQVLLSRLLDLSDPNEGEYVPYTPNIPAPTPGPEEIPPPEEGASPPPDADTKHGNHEPEVTAAKQELISEGMTFSKSSPECPDRFAITKRAVQKIGGDAGFLSKTSGNQCEGKAVDIIAFPDGYIYDILNGTAPDGNGPLWSPAGCGPVGGDGTCPEKYRSP